MSFPDGEWDFDSIQDAILCWHGVE
jgi:hypothetical protein